MISLSATSEFVVELNASPAYPATSNFAAMTAVRVESLTGSLKVTFTASIFPFESRSWVSMAERTGGVTSLMVAELLHALSASS